MPTSASRRVWEGKAGNYNPDIGSLESPMTHRKRELASSRQF